MATTWTASSSVVYTWGSQNDGFGWQRMCAFSSDNDIYILAPSTQSGFTDGKAYLWKSTNDGASFSLANATAFDDYLSVTGVGAYAAMLPVGSDIIVFGMTTSNFYAAKFGTGSDTWTSNASFSIPNYSSGIASWSRYSVCTDGTNCWMLHPFNSEKVMGTDYNRAALRQLTVSSMTWGSDTNVDDDGAETHQVSGGVAVDSNGDFYFHLARNGGGGSNDTYWYSGGTPTTTAVPSSAAGSYTNTIWPSVVDQSGTERVWFALKESADLDLGVWYSPINAAPSWTQDLSNFTENDGLSASKASIQPGPSGSLYVFYGAFDLATPDVWYSRYIARTSGGTWDSNGTTVDTVNDELGPSSKWQGITSAQGASTDTVVIGVGMAGSGEELRMGSTAGPVQKTHSLDMQISLEGSVAEYYHPDNVVVGYPMLSGITAFTSIGIKETDRTTLVARQWFSQAPETTDYTYYNTIGPEWTFSSDIMAFDVAPKVGAVAVQLDDGSVHLGRWWQSRSQTPLSGVLYFSDWHRNQTTYIQGPQYSFNEVYAAPSTAPTHFAVSVGHSGTSTGGWYNHDTFGYVAFNGEPVSSKEKVYVAKIVIASDKDIWGNDDATFTVGAIDGIKSQVILVDPSNTTENEYLAGIPWAFGYADPTYTSWYESGVHVLYTREEASNTYLYQAHVPAAALQNVWTDATSGAFTLTYPHRQFATDSSSINYNDSAASVATALDAMSEISNSTVTGSGTASDPWVIGFDVWDQGSSAFQTKSYYNYLIEGSTNTLSGGSLYLSSADADTVLQICEVAHQTIPKVQPASLGGRVNPMAWGWFDQGESGKQPPSVLVKQTNNKLGILAPTPSWDSVGATGVLRKDLWHWYAQDVSSGNVFTDANGYVAAAWVSETRGQYDDTSAVYPFMQYDFVTYVDATSQDLKRVTRSRYGKES